MIVPLRIGSGTRLKILDAMAMGKAIVSTSVGCEGLDVSDGKNILIADTPEEFATKTIDLLRDPEMRKGIENRSRELAVTYDWGLVKEKQESAYQSIMERSTS
jgi:glycosyltransferase involved in cell wall biosynthesis